MSHDRHRHNQARTKFGVGITQPLAPPTLIFDHYTRC